MPTVVFESPMGQAIVDPDDSTLSQVLLEATPEYWSQGSGSASLTWSDGEMGAHMLVLPHEDHGFYLQYSAKGNTWLSLGDISLLNEVVECAHEWYASVGLFVPPPRAWMAVEEFCRTGKRSCSIDWISPDEVPENGNW